MTRHWFCAYEIDIDADTPEEAARQATEYARNLTCTATWEVRSEESDQGDPLPEISGLVHMQPDGEIQVDLVVDGTEIPCSD